MEQFNSGESIFIFEINFHKFLVGQMIVGKFAWQQEEDQKEDISIALIFQEQFFTSVLLRDTPTRQCDNSAWIIPSYLSHRMCF